MSSFCSTWMQRERRKLIVNPNKSGHVGPRSHQRTIPGYWPLVENSNWIERTARMAS
ncbi:MAG: hypothetical protein R2748_01240 [Bryobacterales bacterium]